MPQVFDWRRPETYAYAEDLTLHEWAFEFLRRNPEYIAAYDRSEELRKAHDRKWAWAFYSWPLPPLSQAQEAELKKDVARVNEASRLASERWGLDFPEDPRISAGCPQQGKIPDPPRRRISWRERVRVNVIRAGDSFGGVGEGFPHDVAIRFDLELPIEPQIEAAAVYLRIGVAHLAKHGMLKAKPPTAKPQRSKFLGFIRAFDAREDGASYGKIALRLFPSFEEPEAAAKNAAKRCRELAAGGYRDLLLKHDT